MASNVSTYKRRKAEAVINRIAEGASIRKACEAEGIKRPTFAKWMANEADKELCDQYARAREMQLDAWADEIIDIADDSSLDIEVKEEGGYEVRGEVVQRSRVRIDSRKWLLSRLKPEQYSEKRELNLKGRVDHGRVFDQATPLADWIAGIKAEQAAKQDVQGEEDGHDGTVH